MCSPYSSIELYQHPQDILCFWFWNMSTPSTWTIVQLQMFPLLNKSKATVATQLTQFILEIMSDILSISDNVTLWDLAFHIDQSNALSILQFETPSKQVKLQMKGRYYTSSMIASHPATLEPMFYLEFPGNSLSDHVVNTYVYQINRCLRYIPFITPWCQNPIYIDIQSDGLTQFFNKHLWPCLLSNYVQYHSEAMQILC